MKQLTPSLLDALSLQAQQSPRKRANRNLHDDLNDPVQRLAIAMEPDTLVRPHRHPHTWEMLFPLRGHFVVLHFDAAGTVIERAVLGQDCTVLENPAGVWHAVLSLVYCFTLNGAFSETLSGQPQGALSWNSRPIPRKRNTADGRSGSRPEGTPKKTP